MAKANESEFLKLYQENQGIVYKICHLYGKTEVDKQDLFQEITIQLWKAFPTFKGTAKFSTWMYRVALNTAITFFRKGKKKRSEVELNTDFARTLTYEDYDDETEQRLKLMYAAIEKLNEIEKALVFLYLEDKAYREIAATLGISEVNARVKMNRVKTKLKKLLN
ncbi:MAG: RNA polymerase sigma factor [Saprospiraceae bacterium]|nr:RNA polymerase sigma factor [Saprospiraceae bacterium]